jgi:hypothetical protein
MGAQLKPYEKKDKGRDSSGTEGSSLSTLQEEGGEKEEKSTDTGYTWRVSLAEYWKENQTPTHLILSGILSKPIRNDNI